VNQPTNDPNSDGVVLSESPQGGTQATAKTQITLSVGKLVQATTTADTTTAPTTTP
jgi:beta-lactam-binding protein with PASTA domain